MIKLSSADWLKIGIENNWVSSKKSVAFSVTNMPFPTASGGISSPGEFTRREESSESSSKKGNEESGGTSVLGVVAGTVGAQMVVEKIMRSKQQVINPAIVNEISSDPVKLKKYLSAHGIVSPEQINALQNAQKPGMLKTITKPGKVRSTLGRGLAAGAGGMGGYMLADWIANATVNQRKGFNIASPSVVEQKSGSVLKFKGASLKLTQIAKDIAGISKSLDKSMAAAVDTVLDLIRQLDAAKNK